MSGMIVHTAGPWRQEDGTTLVWGDCNPDDKSSFGMGYPVAEALLTGHRKWGKDISYDQAVVNARLIAAAPDLLDGCNALLGLLQLLSGRDDIPADLLSHLTEGHRIEEARAAIAKATGKDNPNV